MFFSSTAFLSTLTNYRVCADSKSTCLRNKFSDVVLVIVFNYHMYSSIPAITALYRNAFPTIMFCGPQRTDNYTVEVFYIHKGYYSYVCMAQAMEKHPGYVGYLLINDDVLLNYWNLVNTDRDKIWEGPKAAIQLHKYGPRKGWYWWNSTWGMKTCQKAFNDIWSLQKLDTDEWFLHNSQKENRSYRRSIGSWDVKQSLRVLAHNGDGKFHCYRGRSDVFYIPGKFADAFQTMAYIFYKHGSFLEIAVPTICRMLDVVENFQYLPGIYLPGRTWEPPVREAKYFWELYNTSQAFVHPLKFGYEEDVGLNGALLRNWITEYSDSLTIC